MDAIKPSRLSHLKHILGSIQSILICISVPSMASNGVKVLNTSVSAFGMRVLVALHEKGVQYDYQEEDLQNKSQLLLASNPVHKQIPVLIHNGNTVCGSLIAVQYIDEVWSSEGKLSFLPVDPFQRAVARFWADFVDKKFYDAAARIVVSPAGQLQEKANNDLKDAYITLDTALRDVAGGKPYFGGDCIGLVDIVFAPFICWFKTFEELGNFKLPDDKQCPHLSAWAAKVVEYPSIKKAMAFAPYEKVRAYGKALKKMRLGVQ